MVDLRWCLCALLIQSEMAGLNHQTMNTEGLDEGLIETLGKKAVVELTGLCGYYTMVAMTPHAFGVGTDADARSANLTNEPTKP